MSYQINKTDGTLLTELVDGSIDTSSTDLTLVGRNYKGYGEAFNENFVALLENFASSSAPSNPLKGQIWYDTSDNRLKLYDGASFRVAGGPIVSPDTPTQFVEGDLWMDSKNNKLYMWDGSDLTLIGPTYTAGQGKTTFEAVSMVDTSNQSRTVLALYISGVLAGILSRAAFTPAPAYTLPPYAVGRQIKIGFNPVDTANFKYQGTSASTEALVDSEGNVYTSVDFVRTNERDNSNNVVDQSMLGSLFVKGTNGTQVGIGDTVYAQFKVPSLETTTVIQTLQNNYDFAIRVQKGNDSVDALTIDTSTSRVGIFKKVPTVELDVTGSGKFTGDLTVNGDLTVLGDASYINVETMRVEDTNIELGLVDAAAGTPGDDVNANNGGITLRSSDGDKTIIWSRTTNNWTSNKNFDLTIGNEYRIDDTQVLSKTRLGDTVTTANGLTSIGTLNNLNVAGDITLGGNIINSGAMSITTGGTITFNTVRLTGLDTPTAISDATTKAYVDNQIAITPIALTLDITGYSSPNPSGVGNGPITNVKGVLDSIYPVTTVNETKIARIHCVSYASSVITGIPVTITTDPDTSGTLTKSYISVDSAGTQNESVVQDIQSSNTTSGTFTPSPNRYTMVFQVVGGVWTHQSTS